jgi:FkbM family methyltransferase
MDNVDAKLHAIHSKLTDFRHESLQTELPEQKMSVRYVQPTATVLELGGHVGRNSCVISSILDDSSRHVVLESDPDVAVLLRENRDAHGFRFGIETAALSSRPMVQRGMSTYSTDGLHPSDSKPIATLTWSQLQEKYPTLKFDTLVVDCEGALYGILQDFPDFLQNVNTILIENDFFDDNKKMWVEFVFSRNGFKRVYEERLHTDPSDCPRCIEYFYEAWQRLD